MVVTAFAVEEHSQSRRAGHLPQIFTIYRFLPCGPRLLVTGHRYLKELLLKLLRGSSVVKISENQ